MSDQYNVMADKYDLTFQLIPFRLHVEAYSVFDVLGDVTDLTILELATGTGYYARALKNRGAKRIVAVDIAEEMVQVARNAEQEEPLGIEYHVQDVTQFKLDTPADLALAVYLLHYSPNKEVLDAMCQAIANNLKSGGRFVTYQLNPDIARTPAYYKSMGLNLTLQSTPQDGEEAPFSVTVGDITTPAVTAYRWDKETVEDALTKAGFTGIHWIQPKLSPQGEKEHGKESFAGYFAHPHALLIECFKA